jgi:aryl-alcohol dehydrogenase-like predicted oxidoreductase
MTNTNRTITNIEVSGIGLGAMSLSYAYGTPPDEAHSVRLLNEALDVGYSMIDTAALYGFGQNEALIRTAIGHRRSGYFLASKCGLRGVDGKRELSNDPKTLRQTCEDSLQTLGTDVIDLLYLHRWDKVTPIEDCVGALSKLVDAGKIRSIGLSEVSAVTLRKAHDVHPIAAVQSEYSLWTREPEIAVLDACRELGAAFIPFSPLARGYLTGLLRDASLLEAKDLRRNMPRFSPDNYPANLLLLDEFEALAKEAGCTMGQFALAWLLHSNDHVIPISGTTNINHLQENFAALNVRLDDDAVAAANALINKDTISGPRYVPKTQAEIDTEQFQESDLN